MTIERFRNKLIEIVYSGKYEQPTSIRGVLVEYDENGMVFETKTYRYYIPFRYIKSMRHALTEAE